MVAARNSQYYMKLENQYGAHNYHPIPVVISKAKGVWVWDPEGRKYMDCLASYSAVNQGHRHPKIIKALKEQVNRVTLTSRAFHNDMLGPFLKKLTKIAQMEMALPMNTGAEAVETAIKIARKWGYEKKGVAKNKAQIIVCRENFHGRTTTIVGFSTDPDARTGFGPFTPGQHRRLSRGTDSGGSGRQGAEQRIFEGGEGRLQEAQCPLHAGRDPDGLLPDGEDVRLAA
jgi:ornithine--oxo-acid transaminase